MKGSLCWENLCGCMGRLVGGGGTDCGVCISRDIHGLQLVAMSKLAVRAVKLWLL